MKVDFGIISELKIKAETYYALQKTRIQAQNRVKAFVRDERLDTPSSKTLHFWLDDVTREMEGRIKKELSSIIKDIPIWTQFMKNVLGIGPCLAASLIASIQDIGRFERVSSLWKYAAQDVIIVCNDCKKRHLYQATVCEDCGSTSLSGEAPRKIQKTKITWDPFIRTTLFKLGDSFIKQNAEKSLYRQLYDEKKAYYREKFPEYMRCRICNSMLMPQPTGPDKCAKHPECKGQTGGVPHPTRKTKKGEPIYIHTKDHLHAMARRYAVKIFLEHLWVAWRELEGLPVTKPWIMNQPRHTHYIEPEQKAA